MATSPAAQAAVAELQLAAMLAWKRPRDEAWAMEQLRARCEDPDFADEACYLVQRGKKKDEHTSEWVPNFFEGFGVRFSEEFARHWRNLRSGVDVLYDDPDKRGGVVWVWDLETNVRVQDGFSVTKRVERNFAPEGREVLDQRVGANRNSRTIFVLRATDDETDQRQSVVTAKKLRNLRLQMLPADYKRDLWKRAQETIAKSVAGDIEKARAAVVAFFARFEVVPEQIEARTGVAIGELTPAHIVELRLIANAIRDGESTHNYFRPAKPKPAEEATATRTRGAQPTE